VGDLVGAKVGDSVGFLVGARVGSRVGARVGDKVGLLVGKAVGAFVGDTVIPRVLSSFTVLAPNSLLNEHVDVPTHRIDITIFEF
jgi:uncharacterized membrane protein